MKKHGIAVLVILCMILPAFAWGKKKSDTAKGTKTGGKTTVVFWTLSTRQNAVEPIIKVFNTANPDIEVKAAFYSTDGIKDACKVAASSGALPNMWFNWGGTLGGFYSDNGLTYDLTNYAKDHNWDKKFSAGALSLCTRNGKLTGYPTSYNVIDVYYRKDIFAKYNIAVPQTFDDFEKACATLKAHGVIPISTAGKYGWHVMRFVELLIEHYAGAEAHDAMNQFKTSYNNKAVIQAFTKYKEFVDKGYFPEGFITADPDDTRMAVFSGKAAMDIQGPWYDGFIVQEEQNMNNYGTFAFPSGGKNRLSAFAEMTQFNAKNTPAELDACVRFMDFYYNDANAEKYAEYYNLPIPHVNAKMPAGQPNVPIMIDTADKNGTFTITDQAFPTQIADVLFNMEAALANGQATPEQAALNIQQAIQSYQKK